MQYGPDALLVQLSVGWNSEGPDYRIFRIDRLALLSRSKSFFDPVDPADPVILSIPVMN
jgi:hypothetical protein